MSCSMSVRSNGGSCRSSRPSSARSSSSRQKVKMLDTLACMENSPCCPRPVDQLPNPYLGKCCNQPRPDCCKIPCCLPPPPRCPVGIYVERAQPFRPDRRYEPPTFPFEGLSSYREQFFPKCGDKTLSFKPFATFTPSDSKLEGLSTYRHAYTPKPLLPYQKPPWSVQGQFEPSCAPMEGFTTYRNDFKGCMAERVRPVKALVHPFDPSCAKMEGVTTYRSNYIPYCTTEYDYAKQPSQKRNLMPHFSCAPMDGASTYRLDYWAKCQAKRKSMKPNVGGRFSDARMAGVTTYRNDFNPFHFDPCPPCPCVPGEVYDQLYPDCGSFACGFGEKDAPPGGDFDAYGGCPPCANPPSCMKPGPGCGDATGLFPGCPLPECCQPDPTPMGTDGGGDC